MAGLSGSRFITTCCLLDIGADIGPLDCREKYALDLTLLDPRMLCAPRGVEVWEVCAGSSTEGRPTIELRIAERVWWQ